MKLITRNGFSIIEFVVVLAVILVLLPTVFALYFASVSSQHKAKVLVNVKQNGDNALSTIEYLLQNRAVFIYDDMASTTKRCVAQGSTHTFGPEIAFVDKAGQKFEFSLDTIDASSQKIASSTAQGSVHLTGNSVTIENLTFSCSRPSEHNPPIVTIEYSVRQKNQVVRHEDTATLQYSTKIKLRN